MYSQAKESWANNSGSGSDADNHSPPSYMPSGLQHNMPSAVYTHAQVAPVKAENMPYNPYDSAPVSPPPQRERFSYTRYQLELLTAIIAKIRYPNTMQKQLIAKRVGITRDQVKIWFQNRRRKDVVAKQSKGDNSSPPASAEADRLQPKMVPQEVLDSVISEMLAYDGDAYKTNKRARAKVAASRSKPYARTDKGKSVKVEPVSDSYTLPKNKGSPPTGVAPSHMAYSAASMMPSTASPIPGYNPYMLQPPAYQPNGNFLDLAYYDYMGPSFTSVTSAADTTTATTTSSPSERLAPLSGVDLSYTQNGQMTSSPGSDSFYYDNLSRNQIHSSPGSEGSSGVASNHRDSYSFQESSPPQIAAASKDNSPDGQSPDHLLASYPASVQKYGSDYSSQQSAATGQVYGHSTAPRIYTSYNIGSNKISVF